MFLQSALTFLLLQLFTLAAAAPLTTQGHGNSWQYGASGGVVGFIVLILDIIVFLEVLQSDRDVPHKVLWCVVVFIFPILGMVVYWLFSNRVAHKTSGGYEPIDA